MRPQPDQCKDRLLLPSPENGVRIVRADGAEEDIPMIGVMPGDIPASSPARRCPWTAW